MKSVIKEIAQKENRTEREVRQDIAAAIAAGMANPDPQVQAVWRTIPYRGEVPTPEEVIAWACTRLLHAQ